MAAVQHAVAKLLQLLSLPAKSLFFENMSYNWIYGTICGLVGGTFSTFGMVCGCTEVPLQFESV